MDLSLNADAALRAYLPPESWNGEAQHRFIFRTEDGDEEALLARLVAVQSDEYGKEFDHCVVLRPECAEVSRIFIAANFRYYIAGKRIESWMTPRKARLFNWSLFEQGFNEDKYNHNISRFVLVKEQERDVVLNIVASGWGHVLVYDVQIERAVESLDSQAFRWRYNANSSHSDPDSDLQFLRQTNISFQHHMAACWNDVDNEMRIASHWQVLEPIKRDLLAFKCRNGIWDDLLSVATLALRVQLSRLPLCPTLVCRWNFVEPGIDVRDDRRFQIRDSNFRESLFQWRTAITQVFETENVNAQGRVFSESPVCISSHIASSELRWVWVEPFSQHELLEAHLKLREWALEHFPPEEAERLLAL